MANQTLEQLSADVAALKARIQNAETTTVDTPEIRAALMGLASGVTENDDEQHTRLDELEGMIEKIEGRIAAFGSTVEPDELQELQNSIAALDTRLKTVETSSDQGDGDGVDANMLQMVKTDVATLKTTVNGIPTTIDALEDRLKAVETGDDGDGDDSDDGDGDDSDDGDGDDSDDNKLKGKPLVISDQAKALGIWTLDDKGHLVDDWPRGELLNEEFLNLEPIDITIGNETVIAYRLIKETKRTIAWYTMYKWLDIAAGWDKPIPLGLEIFKVGNTAKEAGDRRYSEIWASKSSQPLGTFKGRWHSKPVEVTSGAQRFKDSDGKDMYVCRLKLFMPDMREGLKSESRIGIVFRVMVGSEDTRFGFGGWAAIRPMDV